MKKYQKNKISVAIFVTIISLMSYLHADEQPTNLSANQSSQPTKIEQKIDSTVSKKSTNQPDTVVTYSADEIKYINNDSTEMIILSGKALLKYKTTTLTAHQIKLDLKSNIVEASFTTDTLKANGKEIKKDSIAVIGLPALTEGDDVVTGINISYNLNTKEGKVKKSKTVMKNSNPVDNTFFQAEKIVKLADNSVNGLGAKITSCDMEEPEYYFLADSIIVTKNDWVLAKPISLHFGDVPVAYFPFLLYKKNSGRHSGLIIPSYDYSSSRGNGLKHLGFFWDISPYFDYTITGDFYDLNQEFIVDQNLRYHQLYNIQGNIAHRAFNDNEIRGWGLNGQHRQEFSPSTILQADYNFVSNTSMVNKTGETPQDRMQNRLSSNASFRKDWVRNGDYLLVSSSLTQFVDTAIVKYEAPSLSYSLSNRYPFKANANLPEIAKSLSNGLSLRFSRQVEHYKDEHAFTDYSNFNLNLSQRAKQGDFTLSSSQTLSGLYNISHLKQESINESQNLLIQKKDSTLTNKNLATTTSLAYNHNLLSRFIKMEERVTYRHDFASKYLNENGEVVDGYLSRHLYNFSTSINTNIYGIFSPNIGSFSKMRHTISPQLSLNYQPDFSKNEFGYFNNQTVDGVVQKIDKFKPSGLSATPTTEEAKLSYSVRNLFDGKFNANDTTKTASVTTRNLFNISTDGSVDLTKNIFSDINNSLTSTLYDGKLYQDLLKLRVTTSGSMLVSSINWDVKKYAHTYDVVLPFNFKSTIDKNFFNQFVPQDSAKKAQKEMIMTEEEDLNFTKMKLELDLSTTFSETRSYQLQPDRSYSDSYQKTFFTNINANLKPTENWSIAYSAQLNFRQPKIITRTTISIVREMHCWEGKFDWDLLNPGFKLLINAKSSLFQELKFDKDTQKRRRY